MTREELVANLINYASLAFKVDASTLSEDTNLNELGTSSVQRVAMSASIENEYDVMIPDSRFGQFETIGKLADFVMEEAE